MALRIPFVAERIGFDEGTIHRHISILIDEENRGPINIVCVVHHLVALLISLGQRRG